MNSIMPPDRCTKFNTIFVFRLKTIRPSRVVCIRFVFRDEKKEKSALNPLRYFRSIAVPTLVGACYRLNTTG